MSTKNRRPPDVHAEYKGPRTVIKLEMSCGFCQIWNEHEKCMHESAWFDKLWICGCECNKDWTPQDVGSTNKESNEKRRRSNKDNVAAHQGDEGDGSTSEPRSDESDSGGRVDGVADVGDEHPDGEDQGLGGDDE